MKTLAVVLTLPLESMSYLSPAHLPHVIPRPLSAGRSLCWWGKIGLASRTLKPLGLIGQNLTRNLNINDPMSSRERVGETSHSLQCPMGGQRENREGGRGGKQRRLLEVMWGPLHSLHELRFSSPSQQTPEDASIFLSFFFHFVPSHDFTVGLKRKLTESISHLVPMRESLNRQKTSTHRQRLPTRPPVTFQKDFGGEKLTNVPTDTIISVY